MHAVVTTKQNYDLEVVAEIALVPSREVSATCKRTILYGNINQEHEICHIFVELLTTGFTFNVRLNVNVIIL